MGLFQFQIQLPIQIQAWRPAEFILTHILDGAARGQRYLLARDARTSRLSKQISVSELPALPLHDLSVRPSKNVIHADRRFETRARDSQIVSEFKSKLRKTEDLIGKLGYSLREIYPNHL